MDTKLNAEKIMLAASTLVSAADAMKPAEEPQRQIVAFMFPELRKLRNEGFSWTQLAGLLRDRGIYLQPSTIRVYYSEMLDERGEELQRKFNEQLVMLAEIHKATNHVDDAQLPECTTKAPGGQGGSVSMSSPELAPEFSVNKPSVDHGAAAFLVCLPLRPGARVLPVRAGIDPAVYESDELMEHPVIPGLFLTKEERTCNELLEFRTTDGEIKSETYVEKNQRVKWETPPKPFPSTTAGSFVKMNPAYFK